MSDIPKKTLSAAEYLQTERLASHKSEYTAGELFAMAGASLFHNQIASNIQFAARSLLQGKPCRVLGSDMRVSPTGTYYFYPDVSIVCGQAKFLDDQQDTLLNHKSSLKYYQNPPATTTAAASLSSIAR